MHLPWQEEQRAHDGPDLHRDLSEFNADLVTTLKTISSWILRGCWIYTSFPGKGSLCQWRTYFFFYLFERS